MDIFDGTKFHERLYSVHDTSARRDLKIFNSTTNRLKVSYTLLNGQISNHIPVFMYYRFLPGNKYMISHLCQCAITALFIKLTGLMSERKGRSRGGGRGNVENGEKGGNMERG